MSEVYVLPKFVPTRYNIELIDTTSNSGRFKFLSPFILGDIKTYVPGVRAKIFENLWQFSKVYEHHVGEDGNPNPAWFEWRDWGWAQQRAFRYPMGKGRKPEYSYWDGEKLGYIDARKKIYTYYYGMYVTLTSSYHLLAEIFKKQPIGLLDYDGYDYIRLGMSLIDVINNPDRIMGHAFVLAMLLTGCWEECLASPTPEEYKYK